MKCVKGLIRGRVRKWGKERYKLIQTQDYERPYGNPQVRSYLLHVTVVMKVKGFEQRFSACGMMPSLHSMCKRVKGRHGRPPYKQLVKEGPEVSRMTQAIGVALSNHHNNKVSSDCNNYHTMLAG